jgi:hypothetical protein
MLLSLMLITIDLGRAGHRPRALRATAFRANHRVSASADRRGWRLSAPVSPARASQRPRLNWLLPDFAACPPGTPESAPAGLRALVRPGQRVRPGRSAAWTAFPWSTAALTQNLARRSDADAHVEPAQATNIAAARAKGKVAEPLSSNVPPTGDEA